MIDYNYELFYLLTVLNNLPLKKRKMDDDVKKTEIPPKAYTHRVDFPILNEDPQPNGKLLLYDINT